MPKRNLHAQKHPFCLENSKLLFGRIVGLADVRQTYFTFCIPSSCLKPLSAADGCHVWSDFSLAVEGGLDVGAFVAPAPTSDDVNAERDRRVRGGFMFGGKLFDFNDKAKAGISVAAGF